MIVRMKNTFRMLLAAMLLSLFALPGYSWQKSFPQKDYVAYFTGNSGDEEAVRYAVSMDGYTYWALNDNEPVIDSKSSAPPGESATRIWHIQSAAALTEEDGALLGHIFAVIAKLAKEVGLDNGYRVISNVGEDAGQTVKHLHFHVLGGEKLPV